MKIQKAKLFEQISAQGWTFAKVEDWELDWWADEIWLLKSVWSPTGAHAYLTFLVDPMIIDPSRKKGEAVYGVGLSASKPESRRTKLSSFMSLHQGWQKELPEFLRQLSSLRDQSNEA